MNESWLGLAMEDPTGWLGYFEGRLVSFLQSQGQVNEFLQNTEPVGKVFPVYTNPQKKDWQGLTDEELEFYTEELCKGELGRGVLRAVDDFLKEKNNASS